MAGASQRLMGHLPDSGATTFEANDLLQVILRRRRPFLITAGIILALAAAVILFGPVRYEGKAVLLLSTDDLHAISAAGTPTSTHETEERRTYEMENQIRLLKSRPLIRRVALDLGLPYDPEFNPAANSLKIKKRVPGNRTETEFLEPSPQRIEAVTDALASKLNISQDGDSDFIDVVARSHDAAKAALIANKIAATYTDAQVAEKRAANRDVIAGLSRQVEELRRQLVSVEQQQASYRAAHGMDASANDTRKSAEIGQLASELASAHGATAEAQARLKSSRAEPESVMSPLLSSLRQQESTVAAQLAQAETMFGSAHPDVQKARAQLAELRTNITAERTRVESQLRNDAAAQRARESRLAHDLGMVQAQSLSESIKEVPLASLSRDAEAMRTVYISLAARLQQLVRANDIMKPDAIPVFKALQPLKPSFPKPGLVMGVAGTAAVMFGIIAAFCAEALDTRLRHSAEIAGFFGLPTLGYVPEVGRWRNKLTPHMVMDDPYSRFTDEIRGLFGRLVRQLSDRERRGNVVLVTSPSPSDGKSTICIGLAAAAVVTRRTAVLVDLDLRRPKLARIAGFEPQSSDLADFMAGRATVEEILASKRSTKGLKAVSINEAAADPGAILSSERLAELIAALKDRFDLVIVNSPPILSVSDAQEIAPLADAVLLVIRWGRTKRDMVRSALDRFDARLTGVVFNRVTSLKYARGTYGRYGDAPSGEGSSRPRLLFR